MTIMRPGARCDAMLHLHHHSPAVMFCVSSRSLVVQRVPLLLYLLVGAVDARDEIGLSR